MAHKPDLDEGWFKIAHSMLPTLLLAKLSVEAKYILLDILAQVYGKALRRVAVLDIPAIARFWGFQRTNAWRGFKQLQQLGIAVVADPDYPNEVRFSKRALAGVVPPNASEAIAGFSGLVKSYDKGEDVVPERIKDDTAVSDPIRINLDTEGEGDRIKALIRPPYQSFDTPTVSPDDTVSGVPPAPPYKVGDLEKGEEDSLPPPAREAAASRLRIDPPHAAPRPSGRPSLMAQARAEIGSGCFPGDVEPDPDELARAHAFNDAHAGGREDIRTGIHQHQRHYPSAWFLRAIKRLRLKGKSPNWGLVRCTLEEWDAAGGPGKGPEDGYGDDMAPLPREATRPRGVDAAEAKRAQREARVAEIMAQMDRGGDRAR